MFTLVVHTHFVFVSVDNIHSLLVVPSREKFLARAEVCLSKERRRRKWCLRLPSGGGKTNRKKLFLIEELFYFTQVSSQSLHPDTHFVQS